MTARHEHCIFSYHQVFKTHVAGWELTHAIVFLGVLRLNLDDGKIRDSSLISRPSLALLCRLLHPTYNLLKEVLLPLTAAVERSKVLRILRRETFSAAEPPRPKGTIHGILFAFRPSVLTPKNVSEDCLERVLHHSGPLSCLLLPLAHDFFSELLLPLHLLPSASFFFLLLAHYVSKQELKRILGLLSLRVRFLRLCLHLLAAEKFNAGTPAVFAFNVVEVHHVRVCALTLIAIHISLPHSVR
jgi:hypothetical protein